MNSSDHYSLLTTWFFALFLKCPLGEAIEGCPFADIRSLQSLELKFQLAENLVLSCVNHEELRHAHEECFRRRRNQLLGIKPKSIRSDSQKERAA